MNVYTDTNKCLSSPCHHGSCEDLLNGFLCHCAPGYEGEQCEMKTAFCSAHNCRNRALCVEGELNYTCSCTDGFIGMYCENEIGKITT